MDIEQLTDIVACGEDSKNQFKVKEELIRLFQSVDFLHGDEVPTKAGIDKLDRLRFRYFLKEVYGIDLPELVTLLQNMNLASESGFLNLAGVLLFAENPEWIKPECIVKGVRFPGNEISTSEYIDSEDFFGPLRRVFDDAMAFLKVFEKSSRRSKCQFHRRT